MVFRTNNIWCHLSPILAIRRCKQKISKAFEVLNFFYGNPRSCGVAIGDKLKWMVLAILFEWDLDAQQGLFKLMMNSNVTQAMEKVSTLIINKVKP